MLIRSPQAMLNILPGDVLGVRGEEVGLDHVVDVGEVPGLLAVAEDDRRLALEQGGDEAGDHRCVLGQRVLARPEDVEVAKRDRLQAVDLGEAAAVALAGELRDRIWRDRPAARGPPAWAASRSAP